MRIGIQTRSDRPLLEEIQWCVDEKFEFIEIALAAPGAALESTAWGKIADRLAESGLAIRCLAAHYLPIDNPSPLVRQAALDEFRRSVDAAARIGASLLSVNWRGWPGYMSEAEGYAFTTQWLEILVRHGRDRGVQIGLVNSADNRHQLKYFRETFHRVPGLRFTYNIGNSRVGVPQSLTRDYMFALADRLSLVQLSDNNGQAAQHLPIGATGESALDLAHELRTLRTFRYDGDIVLDMFGQRRWVTGSRDLIREVWEQSK